MSGIFKKISDWFREGDNKTGVNCTEETVKKVIEELLKEIGLKRKVDTVTYRPKHRWYIVHFFSPPSCIIPRHYLEVYLKTGGEQGKKEIIDILSVKPKGFELICLIALLFLFSGCYNYSAVETRTNFTTPFGYITKGDSMYEVVKLLGNPREVSHYSRKEVWHYNFPHKGELFVYFEKGDVVDAQFLSQVKASGNCNQGGCL